MTRKKATPMMGWRRVPAGLIFPRTGSVRSAARRRATSIWSKCRDAFPHAAQRSRPSSSRMAGGGDLLYPLERNAVPLLKGKRVVGRFEDDAGSQIARSKKYVAADFVGFGVPADPVTEPAEARQFIVGDLRIPHLVNVQKSILGDRGPNSPNEDFRTIQDGYFQATADIKLLLVDQTNVLAKLGPDGTVGLGQSEPIAWRFKRVVHRQTIETSAAAAAGPIEVHGILSVSMTLLP